MATALSGHAQIDSHAHAEPWAWHPTPDITVEPPAKFPYTDSLDMSNPGAARGSVPYFSMTRC
jgi:hypothetical protein